MELGQIMTPDEAQAIGIQMLSDAQQDALSKWGLKMFGLGRSGTGMIAEIKFDGRLIILDTGERWEVDSIDADTSDLWSAGDRVVILAGTMFNIEDAESVDVLQSTL